jgi:glutathione synthase/RimK-type ligase-like ATP-grasp enzyme
MGDFRVAINRNDKIFHHSGLWTQCWIDYCIEKNIQFEIVNSYNPDIMNELKSFDCLFWHIGNYVLQDMMIGRSILNSAARTGMKTFPDFNTSWHFDDKIAETYLLQSVSAPIPDSWMFYLIDDCLEWIEKQAKFPLIAKLRCGSGSNNVTLLKNKSDAKKYAKRMFGEGFDPFPNIFFKTKSQLSSATSWEIILKRIKRIPEFLHTLSRAKKFPKEHGYVFLQEFIPNSGFDLKVVVIGDKLSFIGRNIRKGDYRASGGGDLFFDRSLITRNIIESAFSTSDKLNFQCMGYDYVVDKSTGVGKIIEMSYGFSHTSLLQANGYFDRQGTWYNEPLNAPEEIIKNLIG